MRKVILYSLAILLSACTSEVQKNDTAQHYSISINKQVEQFKKTFQSNVITKIVLQEGIIEQKKINAEQLLKDINSFKEFDINKPAWKNSYRIIQSLNYTRFESLENKLTLKHIDVYGSLNNPDKIAIYFQNNNNLYYSSKYIQWDLKKSYSIFSIQDVKGMQPDTIYIKCTWN